MDESYETSETYEIVTSAPANPKLALLLLGVAALPTPFKC